MVGSLSFMGSYSGIDSSTIDSLIEAESGKLVQYTNKKENLAKEKTAWNDVNTRLDTLYTKLGNLIKEDAFQSKAVTTSDASKLTVKADSKGQVGTYKVQIKQLATASRVTAAETDLMKDKKLTDKLDLSGTLTVGSSGMQKEAIDIQIDSKDSLKDIVGKINDTSKESGVSASIVDNRIILNSTTMGAKTLSVKGDLAETLGFDAATVEEQVESGKGQSAVFSVDGITVTRPSNNIDDVIEGVTFELLKVDKDSEFSTIKVSEDTEKTITNVKEFVSQYNSTMSFIGDQLKVGDPSADNNKVGPLAGDSALIKLQSQLRSLVSANVENSSNGIRNVQDIGISVDRYGTATLDETKLKKVLTDNPAAAAKLFNNTTTTDSVIGEDGKEIKAGTETKTGVAQKMQSLIDSFVSKKNGIIATKADTYDKMIKDIGKQIETFNERLVKKREYYVKTFTALDTAMMEAESQMSYLASQMDSWSK